ncbi:MAG: dUTP diphosphatase [Candidatus Buchananbacteria bacterium]|nr:dUTP diphosphatase [Candidatus Buchananbacteria bacterium]
MQIKIKKTKDDVKLPSYAHPGDAGLDVYSLENYELKPGERRIFDLGFALELPEDFVAIVKDKGSLPKHGGLHTMGGVFDSGYRGEYNILLINLSDQSYQIEEGDKIAQLVIIPFARAELLEVEELTESSRGAGSFGSTGKK